jgi:hypothetical protein
MAEQSGQYGRNRFWEILPGFLAWSTFILAFWSSFFAPTFAVIFIIVFDLYWTLRVVYFLIHVSAAYFHYRKAIKVDWFARIKKIAGWERIYHIVMLPTYKEDVSILRATIKALEKSDYRNDRMMVVVGGEEGDKENFLKMQKVLEGEFANVFAKFIFTVHPHGLKGEIPGKGSNMKWMESHIQPVIDKMKIPYEDILVTAFDADTIGHSQYFARLSYLFLTVHNPLRASYQPLTLYSNNIWQASIPVRITMFGNTFWLLGELVRPERMWTFSSHSMPWKMLVDVGFHEPDLVSEDSRIFLQALIHYHGDYRVEAMFMPVHLDAVEGKNFLDSMKALYKQQRRWAWGVEHLPYMMEKFREHPEIPKSTKRRFLFNHIEGMYTWTTAPILIFVLGYLPFLVAGDSASALISNAPFSLERMMQIATLGVFASGFMSFLFLPPRPEKFPWWNWIVLVLQWVLLPVTFVVFGAFPAIDAQTRFMFGNYLGFNVTEKQKK